MIKTHSTKEELLLLLKKNKALIIDEILEHFSLSEVAIRKQLNILEREGFVFKTKHKQHIGRPYYSYSLTAKGHETFPNQYDRLPVELLNNLEELQGIEVVEALIDKRAEKQEQAFVTELSHKGDFNEKMEHFVALQNQAGYMLEAEKMSDGSYSLINYNCPLANVAVAYERVCTSEKQVYLNLFPQSEVTFEKCMTNGSHVCKWVISEPE